MTKMKAENVTRFYGMLVIANVYFAVEKNLWGFVWLALAILILVTDP